MATKDGQYVLRIADLEKRLEAVEQGSHRGEYEFKTGSGQPTLKPGEMWARSTNTHNSWMEIATAWSAHHIDLSGTNHPLWMIPDNGDPDTYNPDWLFGVETLSDDDIIGSAFFQMKDAANTDTQLSWTVDVLRAEGTPPQAGDTVRAIFTPLSAGGGGDTDLDVYTRAEVDALLSGKLTKGTSTAIQLHNGTTKSQSDFATAHSHPYASSSHTHDSRYHAKYTGSDSATKKKLVQNDHSVVTNDFAKGPVRFSVSGSALYWYNQ